jgi:hypothetical protein
MAVQKVVQGSTIALKLQTGVNASGNPAYVTRNYPCKAAASDQDIFDVGQAIMELQKYPAVNIERIDSAYLINA